MLRLAVLLVVSSVLPAVSDLPVAPKEAPRTVFKQDDPILEALVLAEASIAALACVKRTSPRNVELQAGLGTAFFITSDGLVTAAHVIRTMRDRRTQRTCQESGFYVQDTSWRRDDPPRFFTLTADSCAIDAAVDVAICRLATKVPGARPMAIQPVRLLAGTTVAFLGFPSQHLLPIAARGGIGGYLPPNNPLRLPGGTLVLDRTTWPGLSGGPIVNVDGHVVGMVIAKGEREIEGLTYAVSGELLVRTISKYVEPNKQHK